MTDSLRKCRVLLQGDTFASSGHPDNELVMSSASTPADSSISKNNGSHLTPADLISVYGKLIPSILGRIYCVLSLPLIYPRANIMRTGSLQIMMCTERQDIGLGAVFNRQY